ncbi:3',5'-cyclic-nucleotide phosphodiesterase [Aureococcus anophagefferens]|nr:3',5'-cyclic-nucleotide phosphodiesterase [Aureococcus anophagefferens]
MAKEHLNSDIVTIFLYAPKKRQLWSRWGTNLPSDITTGKTRPIRVPANAGITGQAFSSQEILNVKDAHETAYFNQKVDQMTGYVTRSSTSSPRTTTTTTTAATAASDDEPADKDHALRLAEKRAVRAAVEDLEVRRDRETTEKIRVCPFAKEDLELASGFGKIASRAIATAIDHDEDRKAREEMKEANKEEEKKANFQSHVESIFDFFERRLDFGGTQVSPGGMEAAHTAFKLKQREGELSVKMNAMIRGYLTRRKVVKELKKNGMIVRSITGAAREKTDTMRAKLKDQEKIRKRAFATQQLLRRQKARTRPGPRRPARDGVQAGARAIAKSWRRREAAEAAALAQDAEDAREAIREAVNVAAYEKEEKFAKNFSAKKVQGMARAVGAESVSPTPRSTPMGGRRSIAAVHEVRVKKHGRHARPPGLLSGENIYEYGWRRCQARVRGGQARRRVRLLWAEFYARIGAADDGSVGSTSFRTRDDGDVDFRSHRVASTAPRAVSGAYGGGGRQGRIEAQLLAELRDDLAENDVPTLGRWRGLLLSTTDEGDDESNDGRRVYVQHAYHVPIERPCPPVPSHYPAPSGDPIYVHSPHKDRWLSAHAGVVKKSFKNDKLYREARRNVSRLVRQNRRLEYTSGLERPATTRTTSLPSPRRLA